MFDNAQPGNSVNSQLRARRSVCRHLLTGDARPRFFESNTFCSYALFEEQVRRARSDDGLLDVTAHFHVPAHFHVHGP